MMGDFAVWCITDLATGEIQYVVDDSGGSDLKFLSLVQGFPEYTSLDPICKFFHITRCFFSFDCLRLNGLQTPLHRFSNFDPHKIIIC